MARRSRAREVTLQLLFQWDQNPTAVPRRAIQKFATDRLQGDAEMVAYSLALLDGVAANKEQIDPAITAAATNWRLSRMMTVDRNVLRLGAYELLFDPNGQPIEVVINEAIELARRFGSADSPSFVNGVLDKIGKARTADREPRNESAEPGLLPSPLTGEGGERSEPGEE
jgi:transcription antitermination protein NusB